MSCKHLSFGINFFASPKAQSAMIQRNPYWIVPIVCLLFLLTYGCGKQAPASFERPPAPVAVTTAIERDVPDYLDQIGKFVAREVVSIQPQVSGRIVKIHFTDGANVAAGQVLFTVDPRQFEAQLNVAQANLQEAKLPSTLPGVILLAWRASVIQGQSRGRTMMPRKTPSQLPRRRSNRTLQRWKHRG